MCILTNLNSRLADDVKKRRAILESGRYWIWNISWDDLSENASDAKLDHLQRPVVEKILPVEAQKLIAAGLATPKLDGMSGNAWQQLQAYIAEPNETAWRDLARYAAGFSLVLLVGRGIGTELHTLHSVFEQWRKGDSPEALTATDSGDWCWVNRFAMSDDLLAYVPADGELMANRFGRMRLALRLDDADSLRAQTISYKTRWRRFHALFNLFQFSGALSVFSTSEVQAGEAPEFEVSIQAAVSDRWAEVIDEVVQSLRPIARALSAANCIAPETEFFDDTLSDDLFGEMAWPRPKSPVVMLAGDQAAFAESWQNAGWVVVTEADVNAKGRPWLIDLVGLAAS